MNVLMARKPNEGRRPLGRPPGDSKPHRIMVRVSDELLAAVNQERLKVRPPPSLARFTQHLLEEAVTARGHSLPPPGDESASD